MFELSSGVFILIDPFVYGRVEEGGWWGEGSQLASACARICLVYESEPPPTYTCRWQRAPAHCDFAQHNFRFVRGVSGAHWLFRMCACVCACERVCARGSTNVLAQRLHTIWDMGFDVDAPNGGGGCGGDAGGGAKSRTGYTTYSHKYNTHI